MKEKTVQRNAQQPLRWTHSITQSEDDTDEVLSRCSGKMWFLKETGKWWSIGGSSGSCWSQKTQATISSTIITAQSRNNFRRLYLCCGKKLTDVMWKCCFTIHQLHLTKYQELLGFQPLSFLKKLVKTDARSWYYLIRNISKVCK